MQRDFIFHHFARTADQSQWVLCRKPAAQLARHPGYCEALRLAAGNDPARQHSLKLGAGLKSLHLFPTPKIR